jgi:hypothetical protein
VGAERLSVLLLALIEPGVVAWNSASRELIEPTRATSDTSVEAAGNSRVIGATAADEKAVGEGEQMGRGCGAN